MDAGPSLWLELTPHCNLDCQFCYNPWRPAAVTDYPAMSDGAQYVQNVLRLVEHVDFAYVALSGGEPLLYRGLDDLVRVLHEHGQHTILTTNGRLAGRARLEALGALGLSAVQVPILAASPEIHDRLAGRACWREAILTLALTLELGLQAIVIFVTTGMNVHELPRVLRMVAAMGGRHVIMSELQPVGSAVNHADGLSLTGEAFVEAAAKGVAFAAEAGMSLKVVRHAANLAEGLDFSRGPWSRWTLTPSAELKICNFSAKTLGRVTDMPEPSFRRLVDDLQGGRVTAYTDSVDNCACLRAASAVDAVTGR